MRNLCRLSVLLFLIFALSYSCSGSKKGKFVSPQKREKQLRKAEKKKEKELKRAKKNAQKRHLGIQDRKVRRRLKRNRRRSNRKKRKK